MRPSRRSFLRTAAACGTAASAISTLRAADPAPVTKAARATKVARMAEAAGMTVVPHMSGGGLGYLDVVQFASFTPNIGPFMEFKGNNDLPVECPTSSLKCENGSVRCPSGPGFGVRVDPGYVKKAKAVTVA